MYKLKSLLSLPGKVYVKCLERKCREIVEPKRKMVSAVFAQVTAPRTTKSSL